MKNKFSIALSLAVIVAMLVTSLALADNVQNDVVAGGNDTITAGGSTTVNYRITANNGDGQTGCNAVDTSPATVTINAPAGVTATPGSLTFTSCGTDQAVVFSSSTVGDHAITVSVSDSGVGTYNTNPGKFTLHVNAAPPPSDTTPPVITPSVVGTLGENGWYVDDVTVSWTVEDGESAISSTSGCDETTISSNTAGVTFTCTAASAGGTSSDSVTIKRDASAPSITASANPPANANSWNNSDVTVSYSCTDNGPSGVDAAASSLTDDILSASGTATGTCVDMAGNSADASYDALIDKDAPVVTATPDPTANANGWNNTDVTVSYSCDDGSGSGVDVGASELQDDLLTASDTATGTCVDLAGNSASADYTAQIDKVAPTITFVSRTPVANGFGWNNTDVTVKWTCSDALSGPVASTISVTKSGEGADQSAIGTCEDLAGSTTSDTQTGINIDKTAPALSPSVSPNPVLLNGPATADAGASDDLSGVDTASCGAVNTSSVGSHSVNCSATDKAGNSTSAPATYSVQYATGGMCLGAPGHTILQPINADGSSVFKQKSTVPAKFRVCDANGVSVGTAGVVSSFRLVQTINGTSSDVDEAVVSTTPDTAFRWDVADQQWIFNINTKNLSAGKTYVYRITLNDGSTIQFQFGLK